MERLVRKLDNKLWLAKDIAHERGIEVQADSLKNFKTQQNGLSLYKLNDGVTLERILVAIIAKGSIDKIDYAIFDTSILDLLEIKYKSTLGETPDQGVNDLHVDLVDLSAEQLWLLALKIQEAGETGCIMKSKVNQALDESKSKGYIKE